MFWFPNHPAFWGQTFNSYIDLAPIAFPGMFPQQSRLGLTVDIPPDYLPVIVSIVRTKVPYDRREDVESTNDARPRWDSTWIVPIGIG